MIRSQNEKNFWSAISEFSKIAKMTLFYPCMKIKILWINRIFSKLAGTISKILFILGSYNFLASLECVRSHAWSKGHSDPDLSSVTRTCQIVKKLYQLFFCLKNQMITWSVPNCITACYHALKIFYGNINILHITTIHWYCYHIFFQ